MSILDKMKQAKEVLGNAKKAQQEMEKILVEGESGAGAVKVTMKGNHRIINIEKIRDSIITPIVIGIRINLKFINISAADIQTRIDDISKILIS